MLPRTRLIELSLGGLALLGIAGAYTQSRVTAARADAEHQANQVLQNQLEKLRQDFDAKVADREAQFAKDTKALNDRFDAAAKKSASMAALLSQLTKLPVPVTVTTPPATPEKPNPAPVVTVPQLDFPAVVEYAKQCENCKLELGTMRQTLADRQKQIALANQQIEQLKKENKTVLKTSKGTFFANLKKSAKWFAIGAVAGGAAVCGTGHCK